MATNLDTLSDDVPVHVEKATSFLHEIFMDFLKMTDRQLPEMPRGLREYTLVDLLYSYIDELFREEMQTVALMTFYGYVTSQMCFDCEHNRDCETQTKFATRYENFKAEWAIDKFKEAIKEWEEGIAQTVRPG